MKELELFLIVYLAFVNLAGLLAMGADKEKAIRHAWRIPERALFGISLIGGSVGTWAGMYLFHHKTKHWYFVVGMPLILALQIIIGTFFLGKVLPSMYQ